MSDQDKERARRVAMARREAERRRQAATQLAQKLEAESKGFTPAQPQAIDATRAEVRGLTPEQQRAIEAAQARLSAGMIKVELPDGSIAEFPPGTSQEDMLSAVKRLTDRKQELLRRQAEVRKLTPEQQAILDKYADTAPAEPGPWDKYQSPDAAQEAAPGPWTQYSAPTQTGMTEQAMSGVNEGIAGILGAPVDLMTGAINLGSRGINAVAGTDIAPITDPVGGSGTFRDLMAPTISEAQPQTTAQRYARRVGEEVGAMSVPGGILLRGAKAPLALGAAETASAVGSGVAGQTSREIAPQSDTADFAASMLGGLSPVAMSRAVRPSPRAPTLEELQAASGAGYEAVHQSGATLSPQSADTLASGIEGTFGNRPATRRLNPKAAIASEELAADMRQRPPTISEVDEVRQWIGQNVAGSIEPGERRLGMMMKDAIDTHLNQLQPSDVTGTNRADDVIAALMDAREKSHRVHKSQVFEAEDTGAFDRGLRRAATTGTGGNEINAIRQNVRRVLENPKLRRGYSEVELQAMRDIADGTPTQNALRLLGRLAPTSGALPLAGSVGAAGVAGAGGNPLFLAPGILGQGAKYLGERSTRKQIGQLGELIRNGGPVPKKRASDLENRTVAALLAQSAVPVAEDMTERDLLRSAVVRALMAREARQ